MCDCPLTTCECLSMCVSPVINLSRVKHASQLSSIGSRTPNPAQDKQIMNRIDGWNSPIRCKLVL